MILIHFFMLDRKKIERRKLRKLFLTRKNLLIRLDSAIKYEMARNCKELKKFFFLKYDYVQHVLFLCLKLSHTKHDETMECNFKVSFMFILMNFPNLNFFFYKNVESLMFLKSFHFNFQLIFHIIIPATTSTISTIIITPWINITVKYDESTFITKNTGLPK